MENRRAFLRKTVMGGAAVFAGGVLPGLSAKSYARIVGSNERIHVGVIGVNSRGLALARNFAKQESCIVSHVCDVDKRAAEKCVNSLAQISDEKVTIEKDLRKMVELGSIDAVVVATPDHWHAPAALYAMKAGKHVYLEKPCSYAPEEGEILVKATEKYKRVVQMGNQRRSWPNVVKAIQLVREGAIGEVHFGKSWYTNSRGPIGVGKVTEVPEWLDWDLWQGPAPRKPFKDNIVHYNWHWFWHWGTGEALNNGTHMVDLLRWGMDCEYPTMVSSMGGRYYGDDDWETPDTQTIDIKFGTGKQIQWEGRSCASMPVEGSSVGAQFFGTKGSLIIPGGDAYQLFDPKGKLIESVEGTVAIDPRNLMNPGEMLDAIHINNFFDGIKKGTPLASDIDSGHKSTLLVQLGNIACRNGRALNTDPTNGHILNDDESMRLWKRVYQPGWEMKLD